jgi:hypothetical protein
MRAVRCDACGAKAMLAAGKCPSCGHLFALRDGFGELPPLAYCSSCDSYYPESAGSCRWCGTQPARPPLAPRVWYGVGAAFAAVMVVLLLIRNGASASAPPTRAVTARPPAVAAPLDNDTAIARALVAASDSVPNPPVTAVASVASVDTVTRVDVPTAAPSLSPATKSAIAATSATRRTKPWVRTVSRHWVVVRTGPSRESRVVASIGPNSRVELGESRGSWRRIRTKGISGWVEPRSSFELVASR